jgi:hypothetical protein
MYQESQGIIDIVVKLFMLGQARAMELGVTRKQPEIMNSELLQKVASDHFKIIAPMINALKSGNHYKIEKYNDLRPLENCVQQALQTAQLRMEPAILTIQSSAIVSTPAEEGIQTVVTKLKELGLAEDIAQSMAATAHAEHPGAPLLELVGLISAKLFERVPKPKPTSPAHTRKAQRKSTALSQMERTVAAGKHEKQSAHASLREAGLVKPPLSDING